MIDFLILVTASSLAYIFLRSHGGEGLSIKAQLAPSSTSEGKKDRVMANAILGIMIFAFLFVVFRHIEDGGVLAILMPLTLGIVAFLWPYLRNRQ